MRTHLARTHPAWHGIRLGEFEARADPDAPTVRIRLPSAWGQAAADGLAALLPGEPAIALPAEAEGWIAPLAARARAAGIADHLGTTLHRLLADRQAAPATGAWRRDLFRPPGYVFDPNAFLDDANGFDTVGFEKAVTAAVKALTFCAPAAPRLALGITDFHLFIARLGLDYDADAARDVGACLCALLTAAADAASAALLPLATTTGHIIGPGGVLPKHCAIAGLAEAAAAARGRALAAGYRRHEVLTEILDEPAVAALLGAETVGIAPAVTAIAADGGLAGWARARLAARGLGAEAALARTLSGEALFTPPRIGAHAAMVAALAPHLHVAPAPPIPAALPTATTRRRLPPERAGYTQRATFGGHRIELTTGEYGDGRLGELRLAARRESPAFRHLLDAFAAATSLGLQHGVTLEDFARTFVGSRFGHATAVEGDASVTEATSLLDYVFRNLAMNYLGHVPDAEEEDGQAALRAMPPDDRPLLPLDLPHAAAERRRHFKLVS